MPRPTRRQCAEALELEPSAIRARVLLSGQQSATTADGNCPARKRRVSCGPPSRCVPVATQTERPSPPPCNRSPPPCNRSPPPCNRSPPPCNRGPPPCNRAPTPFKPTAANRSRSSPTAAALSNAFWFGNRVWFSITDRFSRSHVPRAVTRVPMSSGELPGASPREYSSYATRVVYGNVHRSPLVPGPRFKRRRLVRARTLRLVGSAG